MVIVAIVAMFVGIVAVAYIIVSADAVHIQKADAEEFYASVDDLHMDEIEKSEPDDAAAYSIEEEPEYVEEPIQDVYIDVPEFGYWDTEEEFHVTYSYPEDPEQQLGDLKSMGVIFDDGVKYTWYSQNVLPGGGLTELNSNGRTVDENGYITDGEGYISVASSDYPIGTVLDTPFGQAKVYDTGCAAGVVDIYTDW